MRIDPRIVVAVLVSGLVPGGSSWALGTPSGTAVNNAATLQYTVSGAIQKVVSNTSSFRVDEVVNVVAQKSDATDVVVASPDTRRVLTFRITNTGNGPQKFRMAVGVAATGFQFEPSAPTLALDTNGNGAYDPGTDVDYRVGQNDPLIGADQSLTVFVLGDIPSTRVNGDIGALALTVRAVIGTGPAGTVYAGKGANGSDAVIGASTGIASVQGGFVVTQLQSFFTKSQTVQNASGSTIPLPGSLVTYALRLDLKGSGSAFNGLIADTIPANTTYVAGSLRLDGTSLTDLGDADAGRWNGTAVEVSLGTVVAPATHVVTFQVRLN